MNHNVEAIETQIEAWIPKIITILRTIWADYLLDSSAQQASPNLSDWLALLHTAATTENKLPQALANLLKAPQNNVLQQAGPRMDDWKTLTTLLALTFDAAKAEAANLTPIDWQNLIEVQNRILKSAAQISTDMRARPTTGTLTRRALYLQAINQINICIATTSDTEQLLNNIIAIIQQSFAYDYINLFFLNAAKQVLTLQSALWHTKPPAIENGFVLTLDQGIVGRVATTGQGMLVNNVSTHADYVAHSALPDIQSQLAVPLLLDDKTLIGVLDIQSDQLNNFSDDDYLIAQALASHLAIGIENNRLKNAQQRYIKEQSQIYESILALGVKKDTHEVFTEICKKITDVLDVGASVICSVDVDTNIMTALAEYVIRRPGNPAHTWRTLGSPVHIVKDPIGSQVVKASRPALNRAKSETKNLIWRVPANNQADNQNRWNVVLAIPFELDNQVTGLIEVYDKNPNRVFTSEDIQFCKILGTQTALALKQAHQVDETLHRLSEVSMLYTMSQEISGTLDLQDVLDTIVRSLRSAMGCRACCIFLLDDDGKELEIKAANGLKPQWREAAKLQVGEGAAGVAAAEGRTVYLPDTSKDPSFIFFDKNVQSLMVVPLVAQGKVIGTINVDDNHPNAFGPAQEKLLTIAATQAGISIENARLFTRISEEQQQVQAIIQHMADGLLLIDKQGIIIRCNSTLAMMLGMHRNQIVGQNIHASNLHPNLAKVSATTTHRARTGVLAKEVAIESPRARTLQVFATAVTDHNKNPTGEVRVVHDVTKEKELEQLKDDFFSTMSHELRTPLFSIQGFAQLMLDEDELDIDTQKEFLTTIKRQAGQLSEMVNNLLDISKFDEGKLVMEKKPVSIFDVINQTILKLQGYAHQQNIKLISGLDISLPAIIGDAQRLEQVLTNLIGNAIKFSPPGEQVLITASLIENSGILVQVKDNGIGIPTSALESVFSRYYQVSDKNERSAMGSGLGLHIAKQIVEGHDGKIWAESKAGQGSTFCFTLPLSS